MADVTDVLGIPFPEGGDTFKASDVEDLAARVDEVPGVESLTGAEIAGLAAGEKPEGRVVYNSTTGKLQISNGTTFANVTADSLPLAGGTLTGNLTVSKASPVVTLTAASGSARVDITRASGEIGGVQFNEPDGSVRWLLHQDVADGLSVARYNSSGAYQDTPLSIATASGDIAVAGKITGLDAATSNGDAVRYEQVPVGGQASVTTDSSGYATITHGMGVTPTWAVVTWESSGSPRSYFPVVISRSSTEIQVRVYADTGATIDSTAVKLNWVAR